MLTMNAEGIHVLLRHGNAVDYKWLWPKALIS